MLFSILVDSNQSFSISGVTKRSLAVVAAAGEAEGVEEVAAVAEEDVEAEAGVTEVVGAVATGTEEETEATEEIDEEEAVAVSEEETEVEADR